MDIINKNSGFLEKTVQPSDWVMGGETGVTPQIVISSGDWSPYLPDTERQSDNLFDTMACTSFSAVHCVETQMNYYLAKKLLPVGTLDKLASMGYLNSEGKFRASPRFTAKMSGTSQEGNYLVNVGNSVRNDGLLPDSDWQFIDTFDWNAYYADIPQPLKDKSKQFTQLFDIQYEFVASDYVDNTSKISSALQQAPLQIATPVCSPWGQGVIEKCDKTAPQHATMVYGYSFKEYFNDFDDYNPFQKYLAWDYTIPYVMKYVVNVKQQTPPIIPPAWKHEFTFDLELGMQSDEVKALQHALKLDGEFPSTVLETGFYGNITAHAVYMFQSKYRVDIQTALDNLRGRRVGVKSRAQLNKLFNS